MGEQMPLGKKMLLVKESWLPVREEDWDFSSSFSCRVSLAKKRSRGTVSPAKDTLPQPCLPPNIMRCQRILRQRGSGFFPPLENATEAKHFTETCQF